MQALIHRRLAKSIDFNAGTDFLRIHEAVACLVLQKIYIKIVVIVNVAFSVDKSNFFRKIKQLNEK
jgi:hypothetical protein